MKFIQSTILFCLFLPLFTQAQSLKGTKRLESDNYIITWEKKATIHLYDAQSNLLNSYTFEDLPKSKNRIKYLYWANPKHTFREVSRNGNSSFFETREYLFFAFNVNLGLGKNYIYLLSYHKGQNVFGLKKTFYPERALGGKSNHYILGDRLYLAKFNSTGIYLEIRDLFQPDKVLHQLTYKRNEPLEPANTGVSMNYEAPVLLGFKTTGSKTYDEKKEIKSLNKIIDKGSNWGGKIKAFPIAEGMIELSIGAHYTTGYDSSTSTEKLFFFKLVIDENTFEPISNERLESLGIELSNEDFEK